MGREILYLIIDTICIVILNICAIYDFINNRNKRNIERFSTVSIAMRAGCLMILIMFKPSYGTGIWLLIAIIVITILTNLFVIFYQGTLIMVHTKSITDVLDKVVEVYGRELSPVKARTDQYRFLHTDGVIINIKKDYIVNERITLAVIPRWQLKKVMSHRRKLVNLLVTMDDRKTFNWDDLVMPVVTGILILVVLIFNWR